MLPRKRAVPSLPNPIVIGPSQDWDGNDGSWSSFAVRIGTPARYVKTFVSTSGYQTWSIAPQGCLPTDPSNCAVSRGNIFNGSASTTWSPVSGNVSASIYSLDYERNLDYSSNGIFGYDVVGLGFEGSTGPTLDKQVVATVATKQLYVGAFGIDPRSSNFTDYDDPVPSFMSTLFNQSKIPSLSWGYTAGNQYRNQGVFGSLTLGGFDASRFIPNSLSFPFSEVDAAALTVNIQGITYGSKNGSSVLMSSDDGIAAVVDSTIPYIYLPQQICENFEKAFDLEWNDTASAYWVNDTLHDSLSNSNASVDFKLGIQGNSETVNISLPYAAFDLKASYPLMQPSGRYFPLKRAENESQYLLGRTFLQESYLIADYERRNFSVHQCNWQGPMTQDIQRIVSPSYSQDNGTLSRIHQTHHRVLSTPQVVGVVIGVVVGVILCAFLFSKCGGNELFNCICGRRSAKEPENCYHAEQGLSRKISTKVSRRLPKRISRPVPRRNSDETPISEGSPQAPPEYSANGTDHVPDEKPYFRQELEAWAPNEMDATTQPRHELEAIEVTSPSFKVSPNTVSPSNLSPTTVSPSNLSPTAVSPSNISPTTLTERSVGYSSISKISNAN